MRISSLRIENFRSIKELDIELPRICALVGANNTGKSNILLAIQKVLERDWVTVTAFDEDDVWGRDPNADIAIRLTFDPPISYCRFKASDPVAISTMSFTYTRYKVGAQEGQRRLEQNCLTPKDAAVYVPKGAPKKGVQTQFEPVLGIPQEVRESVPLIYIGTHRSLKDQLPSARYSLLRELLQDVNEDFHSPESRIRVNRPDGSQATELRSDRFVRLMKSAMDLLRTEQFNALEASIKRNALRLLGFDPDQDTDSLDFFFAPFDAMDFYKALDLQVREGDFTMSATELGDGIQNALVLSILRAFEERRKQGAILLIEEPEMFLHPQAQRSLYKTLREIGETNQVIYTTHSPHFVTVPDHHEVLLVRKVGGQTVVRRSNLATDAKRREKLIKELDPERNELFFATRLLLVEGDTEKLALPEYAQKLGLDLDHEGATVVEVGGKRNLIEFAKIATSFGIPTGILYDEDSSDFEQENEEAEYNEQIDALATDNGNVAVWKCSRCYEDHLRQALGENKYQELCQKHSGCGKPTRARLIACEDGLPIPEPMEEILRWLANKPGVDQDSGIEEEQQIHTS